MLQKKIRKSDRIVRNSEPGRHSDCRRGVCFQRLLVYDLDPSSVRDDDFFIFETTEAARGIYPSHSKDLCNVLLSQIDAVGPAAGGILCEEIQQVTQLDKGTVVVLMCALVQKKSSA